MIRVPHTRLAPETLEALIEEFVTRDGTDTEASDVKVAQVRRQLESGKIVIAYDEEAETCNIVRVEDL
jgi:uncharacterized protein YheU (UPF0270 family)